MDYFQQSSPVKGLQWSGRSDCGRRANNEDAFLGLQFNGQDVCHLGTTGEGSVNDSDFVFAVSDGMGGAKAGEHASRIAIDRIMTLLPRSFLQSATGLDAGFPDVLDQLFAEIHRDLSNLGESYEECRGMETTLSLCWFTPKRVYFGHIGDSRIYYLPANQNKIRQLSHDDTYVGWMLHNGKISEHEARSHPRRNVLQKALGGANQFVTPQVGAVTYEPGDVFLLCSDGLIEGLYDDQLCEILRAQNAHPAKRLVDEALARDGRDNTTAVTIRGF